MRQQNSPDLIPNSQSNLWQAIAEGLKAFESPPPLKLSEWMDEFFYLSPESSGISGDWKTLPFQVAIANAMSDDDIRVVTWMKCARVGYTKLLVGTMGYFAEHKKRNQLHYQPTDSDADDFVMTEIDTMIRDVPCVRACMVVDIDKKSKDNTRTRKVFKGSILDIKGGKTARNYRRMTKDVVSYDELDGFDRNIDREGSATELGDKRLETSAFSKSLRGSTPRIKNDSQIETSLEAADMVFYRHLPCPECGEHQVLKWSNMKWVDDRPETVKYLCNHCNYKIDYSEYPEMDAQGIWKTDDGYYIDDKDFFHAPDGTIIPKPFHVGFHIWAAYSYFATWSQMVRAFLEANRARKRGDLTKLQTFANTWWAETWEENPGEQIDWQTLMNKAEPYEIGTIPQKGLMLVAGVDVQDNRLAVVVVAYGENEESYRVYWEQIYGDPAQQYVWDELDQILNRSWTHESGAEMHITSCAIDSAGHRTQSVYNYTRTRSPRVISIVGRDGSRPIIGKPNKVDFSWEGTVIKDGAEVWTVGVDTAKSILIPRMKITEHGPGYFHTPIGLPTEYYEQVTAEKYVTKISKGVPYSRYEPTGRNEAIDCEVYAYAAAQRLGLSRKGAGFWNAQKQRIQEFTTYMQNKPRIAEANAHKASPLMQVQQKSKKKKPKIVKSRFMG